MKVAAGEHDGALGRGYEEKIPDIAAGIETSFERELVQLYQALRGNHFLVDFGLLDLVHVGADQTGRGRRDHPLQNVVDARLGREGQSEDKCRQKCRHGTQECARHGRQKLLLWKRQRPSPSTTTPKSAVDHTGIQLSIGWFRIICLIITLTSEVFGST